jgi:hypothetical protein
MWAFPQPLALAQGVVGLFASIFFQPSHCMRFVEKGFTLLSLTRLNNHSVYFTIY